MTHDPSAVADPVGILAEEFVARYRSGEDPTTEIPPLGLLPYRALRARPYLYTAKEIRELLQAAQNLRSTSTLKPWTYYCLFGLLATTGMRISGTRRSGATHASGA